MTFFPIDGDLRPIAEKKLHHVQIIGMVLPNICMSQDMFCIFMSLSVEIYINDKNSSSNGLEDILFEDLHQFFFCVI